MKPRTFWPLVVLGIGALVYSMKPGAPPPPPAVAESKGKGTESSTPPSPAPTPLPPVPPPADPLLRRWQQSVRQRDEKGVLAAQAEFLRREDEYREPLTAMAKEDADPRIRAFCTAVLGRMKSPPPEEFFVGRLADAHEYPRTSALQALENRGTAKCLAEADRLAAGDPSNEVRAAAAQAAKAVRSR